MEYRLLSPNAKVLNPRSYLRRLDQWQLDFALSIENEDPPEICDSKIGAKKLTPVASSE